MAIAKLMGKSTKIRDPVSLVMVNNRSLAISRVSSIWETIPRGGIQGYVSTAISSSVLATETKCPLLTRMFWRFGKWLDEETGQQELSHRRSHCKRRRQLLRLDGFYPCPILCIMDHKYH